VIAEDAVLPAPTITVAGGEHVPGNKGIWVGIFCVLVEFLLLFNVYFPNGKASEERLAYKLDFYAAFRKHVNAQVKAGRRVVICGDVNTAHRPIDLARPEENETISGFLPEERAWLDAFTGDGWIDTFRAVQGDKPDIYTWWSQRSGARLRNVGWRIDYFFVDAALRPALRDAWIRPEIMGSDHCPLGIELSL